jgi:L-ascorbate 6-phosphate lactonase
MDLINKIELIDLDDNQLHIYFLGQSGYVLKSKNLIIYIDPYLSDFIENYNGLNQTDMVRNYSSPINPSLISKCNAIICTHSHIDHMDPWTIENIKTKFNFYASIGAISKSDIKISKTRTKFLSPAKPVNIENFKIFSFPAAHYELTDNLGRPDCLSVLIQWKNKTLFFWGDGISYRGQNDLLSMFNFDYFFAPINGRDSLREKKGIIGNINENELANISNYLNIKYMIPNHYDMFNNNTGSVDLFQKEIKKANSKQSLIIMKHGDKIELQGQ